MDFKIIALRKRPPLDMLLRREVTEDGSDAVVLQTFIPRGDGGDDWDHAEVVDFGHNVQALRSYINTFSPEAAHEFYIRAKAEAERNTEKPDPPTPQPAGD